MAEDDDDVLMALVQQKRDQHAFRRLVARHLTSIHRYLLRLTGSAADADELCQETFLKLWARADSYRPGKVRLGTWLHRIAHNLAVDELRRPRPEGSEALDSAADPGAGPEALTESSRARQRLEAAMAALPANQRSALLLCQVQGFSNAEAARIMGVSVRSLESLLARARRTLRTRLEDIDGSPP